MDNSFEIKGTKFKVSKINAFEQFHIVRRLAPVLKDMIPVAAKFNKLQKSGKKLEDLDEDEAMAAVLPIVDGISKLSDEDSERVLLSLLKAAEINTGGAWAKIANEKGMMFDNLDLPVLLQVAGRVFMYNISGFFSALPQVSPGPG